MTLSVRQLFDLSPEARGLEDSRVLVHVGRAAEAIPALRELASFADASIQGEAHMLLGFIRYQDSAFDHGLVHYARAREAFERCGSTNKMLIAEFNRAQCLLKLGQTAEGYNVEQQLLAYAEDHGYVGIRALCLRSLAVQRMRFGALEESIKYFSIAETLFQNVGKANDAALCCLHRLTLEVQTLKISAGLCQTQLSHPRFTQSARLTSFSTALKTYCDGQEMDLSTCDTDATATLALLSDTRPVKRGREALREKLLAFLMARPQGATPHECIDALWQEHSDWFSLQKRLHTLIYRINLRSKIISFDGSGRYRLC